MEQISLKNIYSPSFCHQATDQTAESIGSEDDSSLRNITPPPPYYEQTDHTKNCLTEDDSYFRNISPPPPSYEETDHTLNCLPVDDSYLRNITPLSPSYKETDHKLNIQSKDDNYHTNILTLTPTTLASNHANTKQKIRFMAEKENSTLNITTSFIDPCNLDDPNTQQYVQQEIFSTGSTTRSNTPHTPVPSLNNVNINARSRTIKEDYTDEENCLLNKIILAFWFGGFFLGIIAFFIAMYAFAIKKRDRNKSERLIKCSNTLTTIALSLGPLFWLSFITFLGIFLTRACTLTSCGCDTNVTGYDDCLKKYNSPSYGDSRWS